MAAAWLAEEADTCPSCGHPMSVCRDPSTARTWQVVEEICEPSRVVQVVLDNNAEAGRKARGLHLATKRTGS